MIITQIYHIQVIIIIMMHIDIQDFLTQDSNEALHHQIIHTQQDLIIQAMRIYQ